MKKLFLFFYNILKPETTAIHMLYFFMLSIKKGGEKWEKCV